MLMCLATDSIENVLTHFGPQNKRSPESRLVQSVKKYWYQALTYIRSTSKLPTWPRKRKVRKVLLIQLSDCAYTALQIRNIATLQRILNMFTYDGCSALQVSV